MLGLLGAFDDDDKAALLLLQLLDHRVVDVYLSPTQCQTEISKPEIKFCSRAEGGAKSVSCHAESMAAAAVFSFSLRGHSNTKF